MSAGLCAKGLPGVNSMRLMIWRVTWCISMAVVLAAGCSKSDESSKSPAGAQSGAAAAKEPVFKFGEEVPRATDEQQTKSFDLCRKFWDALIHGQVDAAAAMTPKDRRIVAAAQLPKLREAILRAGKAELSLVSAKDVGEGTILVTAEVVRPDQPPTPALFQVKAGEILSCDVKD